MTGIVDTPVGERASWSGGKSAGTLRRALGVAVIGSALLATACGDDDDSSAIDPGTDAPAETLEIVTTDYSFGDLPSEIAMGTRLGIRNESTSELHEVVAFRLADDVDTPVAELLRLPQEELMPMLGAPSTVLLQAPGSSDVIPAVGDGTLTEAGRYVLICSIPSGADPAAYLAAAAESDGEAPQGVPGGPPHFVNGMFAELVVTP